MNALIATLAALVVLGAVFVLFFWIGRGGEGKLKGPFRMGLEVKSDGQRETDGISAEKLNARHGSVIADDRTGKGIKIGEAVASEDIKLTSHAPPKNLPL
jgi:hypothetical protein